MPYRNKPVVQLRRWYGQRWSTPRGCLAVVAVLAMPLSLTVGAGLGWWLARGVFGLARLWAYLVSLCGAFAGFGALMGMLDGIVAALDRLAAFAGRLELGEDLARIRVPGLLPKELTFPFDAALRIRCASYRSLQNDSPQTMLVLERGADQVILRADGELGPQQVEGRSGQLQLRRGKSLELVPEAPMVELEPQALHELLALARDALDGPDSLRGA